MTTGASQLGADDLASHAAFLTRLARALARGPDEAEDLVQDAYLTALRHPPDPDRPARPWFAQVVRNLVRMRRRGEARRHEREQVWGGDSRAVPTPEQLLERAHAHRALAEQVVLLDEPFRRTLLLRFVEGLDTARIAELEGIAQGTVRWRIKQGLDRLRAGLEEQAPGGRWLRALVPLAPGALPAAAPAGIHWIAGGALIMKAKSKLALVLAALAAVGGSVALVLQRQSAEPAGAAVAKTAPAATAAVPHRVEAPLQPAAQAPDARPLALVAARAEPDPGSPRGSIEGRVMNWSTAAPVSGAEVVLTLADGASSTLSTDGEGRFRFEPERPGLVTIAAITAPGYLPFAPEWGYSAIELMARPGVKVTDLVIYLSPAVDYVGVVVSADGKPVPGAEVRIIDLPAREQELISIPDRFTTDGKGEFKFHAPDAALFEARARGHGPGRARLDQTAVITHRLTIKLAGDQVNESLGTAKLSGLVVDGAGQPLAGVLVSASPEAPDPPPRTFRPDAELTAAGRAVSAADGRFAIDGLDPGPYEVVARDREHTPGRASVVLEDRRTAEVKLEMTSGALLTGRVRDTAGEPVPAFTVVVFEQESLGRGRVVATRTFVDSGGAFTVEGLEARDYRLLATAHSHAPSRSVDATAVLPPAKPSAVEIELPAGATLSGVVRDPSGKPIEWARVSVEGGLGEGSTPVPFFASAVTDARGEFVLRGLAPGRRSVSAIAGGHHGALLTGIEVTDAARIGPVDVVLTPLKEGETPTIEMAGIGAALAGADDALQVNGVVPGGGAEAAGLVAGDQVVTIDGRPVVDIGFDQAIQAIRGPVGSTLRLGLRRPANPTAIVEVTVTRVKIRF